MALCDTNITPNMKFWKCVTNGIHSKPKHKSLYISLLRVNVYVISSSEIMKIQKKADYLFNLLFYNPLPINYKCNSSYFLLLFLGYQLLAIFSK